MCVHVWICVCVCAQDCTCIFLYTTVHLHLQKMVFLEQSVGVQFTHIRVLAKAFTHSSMGYTNLTRWVLNCISLHTYPPSTLSLQR